MYMWAREYPVKDAAEEAEVQEKTAGFHPEKKFLGEKWAWQFHAPWPLPQLRVEID